MNASARTTAWRTIIVHLDDSRHAAARLTFACDLARRSDAHLIGLYVVCQDLFRPIYRDDESLRLAVNEAQQAERARRAEDSFNEAARLAGVSAEWRAPRGEAIDAATLHARHADVLVLGQYDPDDPAAYIASNFVGDLVMASGVPAIVLPYIGKMRTFGENVLIAWDASREAARAVHDALPILRRARFVTIQVVQHGHNENLDSLDAPEGIDLAAYLARHGVSASFATMPHVSGMSVGASLLSRLSDVHADLLVMGAYGHTRVQERVLGGVTRTMLETMTVPVLMSH